MRRNLKVMLIFRVFLNFPFDEGFSTLSDAMNFPSLPGGFFL